MLQAKSFSINEYIAHYVFEKGIILLVDEWF